MNTSKITVFALCIVLVSVIFAYKHIQDFSQTGFNWFSVPQTKELYILDYEKEASRDLQFSISSSEKTSCSINYCNLNNSTEVNKGSNLINLDTGRCEENSTIEIKCNNGLVNRIVFQSNSLADLQKSIEFRGLEIKRNGGYLNISFSGVIDLGKASIVQFDISANNKSLLKPLYKFHSGQNNFSFSEKVTYPGSGEIRIEALGVGITKNVEPISRFSFSGVVLLILSIIFCFVFYRKSGLNIAILILLGFLIISASQTIHFRMAKSFGLNEWIIPAVFALLIIGINKKQIGQIKIKLEKKYLKEILIFTFLYLLFVLSLKTFIGPYDIWWPYYSRHTETVYQLQTSLYQDELSYLGRGGTYPPAFFEFGAQISSILNLGSFYDMQFLLHAVLIIFYAISSYLLFINFGRRERIVALLLYATMSFTLITTVIGTLHVFSFIFLNTATILYNIKGLRKFSPLALGLALASHPITIFLFPFYVYATNKFELSLVKDLKPLLIIFFSGIIVSLIFYATIFYSYGLPHSIESRTWGFLLTYGFAGLMSDFRFGLPLAVLAIACGLFNKKFRVPSIILTSILIFYSIVAYRVNMFASIMIASLFVSVFKDYLKNKFVLGLIVALLASHFIFIAVIYSGTSSWCTWGSVKPACTLPLDYIRVYSPTSDSVAINPEFGHLETFLGERRVLADLYVEYADQKKYTAENMFYQEYNSSYLKDFNISWMILDDLGKERDLPGEDRVYDNGFMHIYREY